MEKYHIYEEIGKGAFSQVFKGRERKKIEYVAIKRIEKSMMAKTVAEVQVMHRLSHAHVLKFHDWYETKNNLWLILEYCTGGDLEKIVKQDGHLPETSVRIFGLDMIAGMQYLHSIGFIHGDIRPRNFLIDEYGIVKVCDFKYTVKIPKDPLGSKPLVERGTPLYMSPELFTPDGVPSYQSDFWALGCTLYEIRRGFAPFGPENRPLESLIESIRHDDPLSRQGPRNDPSSEVSVSAPLRDLMSWLLEKNPMNRCDWNDLCGHGFWKPVQPVAPTNLPLQTAYENYVLSQDKARSASLQRLAAADFQASMSSSHAMQHYQQQGTPARIMPMQDSTPLRAVDSNASQSRLQRRDMSTDQTTNESALMSPTSGTRGVVVDAERTPAARHDRALFQEAAIENTPRGQAPRPVSQPPPPQQVMQRVVPETPATPAITARGNQQQVHHQQNEDGPQFQWDIAPDSLLIHSSDTQVKPIVGNKAVEESEDLELPASQQQGSSFPIHRLERIQQMSQAELENHLTVVYKALFKTAAGAQANVANATVVAALTERVHCLLYLAQIASSAEAANVVLNTHFLALILKLLKSSANYQATQPLRNQSSAQNVTSAAVSLSQQARFLCANVLGLMLRYATFIQPPSIRARDDHIVNSLVTVLKDAIKAGDVKFRRRACAALGEIVFYISAQDEEGNNNNGDGGGNGGSGNERWTLPNAAVEYLIKAVKDDNDETVRHYCAKTIENVLAQGGIHYKKRFITLDLAVHLLDLAQNSRNESLQATCSAALFHILYFVMNFHLDPSCLALVTTATNSAGSISSRTQSSSNLSATTTAVAAKKAAASAVDPFLQPTIVNGAKFFARVLEKASMATILEVLKDGSAKIQQAFLNIVLLIFLSPLGTNIGAMITMDKDNERYTQVDNRLPPSFDPLHVATVLSLLNPSRSYFIRAQHVLLPALLRLIEQGGMTSLRAKALLLTQVVSSQMPQLITKLPERKLSIILLRNLEPLLSIMELMPSSGNSNGNNSNAKAKFTQPTYLMKAAMSMTNFLKNTLIQLNQQLAGYVQDMAHITATDNNTWTDDGSKDAKEDNHGNGVRYESSKTPSKASPVSPTRAGKNGKAGPGSTARLQDTSNTANNNNGNGQGGRLTVTYIQLHQLSDLIRAATSAIAQPTLCRLILPASNDFILALAQAFSSLPAARARLVSQPNNSVQNMSEALSIVEQTCLASLECVSQVEIPDYNLHNLDHHGVHVTVTQISRMEAWTAFTNNVLMTLLPSASQLLTHPAGDIRVVLTATLRRLVPQFIRALIRSSSNFNDHLKSIMSSLSTLLQCIPQQLNDMPPVPQYTIRLWHDVIALHPLLAREIMMAWRNTNAVGILVQLLQVYSTSTQEPPPPPPSSQPPQSDGEDDNISSHTGSNLAVLDPQLILLLRCLWDSGGEMLLLQSDLAGSLTVAVIATVYAHIVYPFPHQLTAIAQEVLTPLVEFVVAVLHLVLRALSSHSTQETNSNSGGSPRSPQRHIQAEQQRKLIMNLRATSPALLLLVACAESLLGSQIGIDVGGGGQQQSALSHVSNSNTATAQYLLEMSMRGLGMLFDLFPDIVASQLLSRQTVLLDSTASINYNHVLANNNNHDSSLMLSPRVILAAVMKNRRMDAKVTLKVVKILSGVAKVATSMGHAAKVKELISLEPCLSALQYCCRMKATAEHGQHTLEVGQVNKLAQQMLEANR